VKFFDYVTIQDILGIGSKRNGAYILKKDWK